ncbi:MAG: aspartyl-phosphate phosphatase Spo0E family protein [Ruminiclostridium sp.]
MLVEEINELREELNRQVENCSLDNKEILTLSQNLDELITKYYKYEVKLKL